MSSVNWKNTHFVLNAAIVCVIVLVVAIATAGFLLVIGKDATNSRTHDQQIEAAGDNLLSNLKEGDSNAVYKMFSTSLQNNMSEQEVDDINKKLKEIRFADSEVRVSKTEVGENNDQTKYLYEFVDEAHGNTQEIEVELTLQNGKWVVTNFDAHIDTSETEHD